MTSDTKTTTPTCAVCAHAIEGDSRTCSECHKTVCENCANTCMKWCCDAIICDNCACRCECCAEGYCPEHISRCDDCEEYVCDYCIHICEHCGDEICRDCLRRCADCDEIFCEECLQWDEDAEVDLCPGCMEGRCKKTPKYDAERVARMRSHARMFTVGLEIEINGTHDADALKDNPLIAGYCRDGSLYHRDGMEYQTQMLFADEFDDICGLVESIHTVSDEPERAGGHMHVRRTSRQTPSRWYWALKGLDGRQAVNLNMRHVIDARWCLLTHGSYSGKNTAVNADHDKTIELRTFGRWDETTAHRLRPALEWAHHMWRYFQNHDLYQLKTADIMRESAKSAYHAPLTTPAMRLAARKEN